MLPKFKLLTKTLISEEKYVTFLKEMRVLADFLLFCFGSRSTRQFED